jgi:hypothetical protein
LLESVSKPHRFECCKGDFAGLLDELDLLWQKKVSGQKPVMELALIS